MKRSQQKLVEEASRHFSTTYPHTFVFDYLSMWSKLSAQSPFINYRFQLLRLAGIIGVDVEQVEAFLQVLVQDKLAEVVGRDLFFKPIDDVEDVLKQFNYFS